MNGDNVFKRLQSARVALQKVPLKESGRNTFAGYSYMELGDFLPQINTICAEHGLCGVVSFAEVATLTIVNIDKPEESIVFSSPMSTAELKGCHPVQNLGAVQSYLRRYLWINAFDIVEHDALDSTNGQKEPEQKRQQQGAKSSPPAANVSEADTAYHERVKTALKTIFGDNKVRALDKIEELTSFVPRGKTEAERVKGVRDFTKLSGKRLEILAHSIEKLIPKDAPCPACGSALEDNKCWNVGCSEFAG